MAKKELTTKKRLLNLVDEIGETPMAAILYERILNVCDELETELKNNPKVLDRHIIHPRLFTQFIETARKHLQP